MPTYWGISHCYWGTQVPSIFDPPNFSAVELNLILYTVVYRTDSKYMQKHSVLQIFIFPGLQYQHFPQRICISNISAMLAPRQMWQSKHKQHCTSLPLPLPPSPLGKDAVIYLAAAVSDVYIPHNEMSKHKITSSQNLQLSFHRTPKLITPLRNSWSPQAFTVTFKVS